MTGVGIVILKPVEECTNFTEPITDTRCGRRVGSDLTERWDGIKTKTT